MAGANGTIWLPVAPSFRGFGAQVVKEASGAARQAGAALDSEMGKAGQRAGAAAGKGLADGVRSSAAQVEKATSAVVAARKREADAAANVALAEARLADARAKGANANTIAKNEAAIESARRRQDSAARQLAGAEGDLDNVRKGEPARAQAVVRTSTQVEQARLRAADASDKVRLAEQKVSDVQSKSGASAVEVARAQGDLTRARSEQTSAVDTLRAKEELYTATLADSDSRTEELGNTSTTTGEKVRGMAGNLSTAAEKARGYALGVVGAVGIMGKIAFSAASEAQQAVGAVESVFGQHASTVQGFANSAAQNVGLASSEYGQLSAVLGAQMKNLGVPMDKLAGETDNLIGIGADMAAAFGGTTSEAVEALGSALRGERDPIERYGVSLTQASIDAWKAKNGMDGLSGAADQNANLMATLALITEQTASVQGQFGREVDTAAGQQQRATAEFENAKIAIGQGLLPVVTKAASVFAGFARTLGEHPTLVMVLAGVLGTLAVAILAINAASKIYSVVTSAAAIATWKWTASLLANPITWVVIAIAALIAGLVLFFTKTETGKKVWQGFMDVLGKAGQFFKDLVDLGKMVIDTLFKGDFKGAPFGIEEDSGIVDFLFDIREGVIAVWDTLKGVFEFGKMVFDVLFGGEFSGAPFGIEEDSGVVTFLFTLRDAAITTWNAISTAFTTGAAIVSAVFNGIITAIKWIGAIFTTVFLAGIIIGWNMLASVLSTVYNGLIKPVFDGWAMAVQWLWTTILLPVFGFIQAAWIFLGAMLMATYTGVVKPVFDWFGAAAQWLWAVVLLPTFNAIKAGFQAVGDFFMWVWTGIIKPAWDGLGAGVAWVTNSILIPTWNALKAALGAVGSFFQMVWSSVIKPAWDALGNGIRAVVTGVIIPAWDLLKSGLSSVQSFFSTVVEGIRSVWDAMKGHVARPINFVIDTVWNQGLVPAWNKVSEFIPGLPVASTLNPIAFATGGAVPLTQGAVAGKDSVHALMMPNEHVLTTAEVEQMGGHQAVYAMRALINRGEPFSWDTVQGLATRPRKAIDRFANNSTSGDIGLPRYAKGGEVRPAWKDQLANGHRAAQMRDGNPYTWGFEDCSGYMSMIADAIINGGDGVRRWATGSFPGGQPWVPGLGEGFSVGVHDNPGGAGGGHTAGTLSAVDQYSAVNVESGGAHGRVAYGGPAAGADDAQWDGKAPGRFHLGIGADGAFESAGGPSPDKQRGVIEQKIREIIDNALDPIINGMSAAIGDPPPHWLGIPPELATLTKDGAVDALFDVVNGLGDKLRSAYDLAKNVTTSITGLFRDEGGYVPTGQSVVTNETGKPEAVFNWKQVDAIRDILNSVKDLDSLWVALEELGKLPEIAEFNKHMEGVLEAAGKKALDSFGTDALDFFGFGEIVKAGTEIAKAFEPNTAPAATAGVTSGGVQSAIATSGPTSAGGGVTTHGDPNLVYETSEVALTTPMPDLDANVSPGSGDTKAQVKEAFAAYGWDSGAQWEAVDFIVNSESSWNPMARNPSSGAFGLFQFLGATKDQYLPDSNPNPKIQGAAGARYIKDRYGDPLGARRFWEANHWYDQGGLARGLGYMAKNTLRPERVLDPNSTDAFERWLDAGTSNDTLEALSGIPNNADFAAMTSRLDRENDPSENPAWGRSGPLVNIEKLEARDEEEAMRKAGREAKRVARSVGFGGGYAG